jgi:EmrB/QacA subfamily drug resistance transporter
MATAVKHPWLLFLGIAVGSLMSGIDFLAISVAIDPMGKSLGVDVSIMQWFLTAFAIGNSSFLVTSGRLSDLYGRKTIFIISSLGFIISSAIIASASSPLLIITARLFQGASSGATTSSAIAILANIYKPEERTRWIAGLVGTTGLGMALGPTLGGVLIHYFSWRMVFLINLPLGLLGLGFTLFFMPKQLAQPLRQKLNLLSMILFTAILVFFTIGISQGSHWGWNDLKTTSSLAAALLLTLIFIYFERKSPHPLIEFKLFNMTNFLAGNAVASCIYFALTAWTLIFGIYLERVAQMSPQEAGLTLFPFGLAVLLLSTQISNLSRYVGLKNLIVLGCGIGVIAFGGMALLPVHPSFWALAPLFMLFGGCFIIVNSCTMQAALEFIPLEKAGIASGKSMMIRWLWGAIGAVSIATVFINTAWTNLQKSATSYPELNTPQNLNLLQEVITGQKATSSLPAFFSGKSLSLARELVDQSYHKGLVISMLLLVCFLVTALLISHFQITSSKKQ